jgi:hypothetical protein
MSRFSECSETSFVPVPINRGSFNWTQNGDVLSHRSSCSQGTSAEMGDFTNASL